MFRFLYFGINMAKIDEDKKIIFFFIFCLIFILECYLFLKKLKSIILKIEKLIKIKFGRNKLDKILFWQFDLYF